MKARGTGVADRGLARSVRGGAAFGAANVLASRLLQFVTTAVLARLVAPEHFGALAVALAVQLVAMNASELGATASLGRGVGDPARSAPTVYTIALVTSSVLAALMAATAGPVARLMGDPAAAPVVRVLALTVLLSGVTSVPSALMWRDFLQGRRLVADLAAVLVTTALVVPMALAGWGAMALAWSRVGGSLAAAVLYLVLSPQHHLPGFDRREARQLLAFGLPLAAANIVVFLTLNLDYVVIGRELHAEQLGLYLIAFNLAALPTGVFTSVIRTVAVPAFGRLHERGELAERVPAVVALVALVSVPCCALLGGLARPLVTTVYGQRWAPAAVALAGLAVFSFGRVVSEVLADLTLGLGRTTSMWWVQVAWFAALLPALVLGVGRWGLAGAGVAHAVVVWTVVLPAYARTLQRAGVGLVSLARALVPASAAGVGMAAVAGSLVRVGPSSVVWTAVAGTVALLVYVVAVARPTARLLRELGVDASSMPRPVRRLLPGHVGLPVAADGLRAQA